MLELSLTSMLLTFLAVGVPFPMKGGHSPGPPVSTAFELAELEREVTSARPEKRRRAVKKLAQLGDRRAWDLVIERLEDAEPEVADEAQLWLGRVEDERVIADLLGSRGLRSRDEWVRLRVAEALGRVPRDIEADALLRHVRSREPELARTLLWSVERLAVAGRLAGDPRETRSDLRRTAESSAPGDVRAQALAALLALLRDDPESARRLAGDAVGGRVPELACAALELARGLPPDGALELCGPALAHEAPNVRAQAVVELARAPSLASVRVLAERLAVEPRLRTRWRIVDALQRASGLRFRLDPRPWQRWAEHLPEDWVPKAEDEIEPATGRSKVADGLPVYSDRVCFLVDFSGSQWYEREDGTTRKASADAMLAKALSAVEVSGEEMLFNVVPYTGEPLPWSERMKDGRERNVRDALETFEKCRANGRGNFYDAARFALEDPRVDTIVVLTDGAPTGGRRWNLELMFPLLENETRFRCVAFDSVLVGAVGKRKGQWAEFAERTGGRSMVVEL